MCALLLFDIVLKSCYAYDHDHGVVVLDHLLWYDVGMSVVIVQKAGIHDIQS